MAKATSKRTVDMGMGAAIEVKRGPRPRLIPRRSALGRLAGVYDIVQKLRPGEWFEVPATARMEEPEKKKILTAIRAFIKRGNLAGMEAGISAESGAVTVFSADAGESE